MNSSKDTDDASSPEVTRSSQFIRLRWAEQPRFYTLISPARGELRPFIELVDTELRHPAASNLPVMTIWPVGCSDPDERPFRQMNGFRFERCDAESQAVIIRVLRDTVDYMDAHGLLPARLSELLVRAFVGAHPDR